MPLCARTSTYLTGIAGESGSGFDLGFVEDCDFEPEELDDCDVCAPFVIRGVRVAMVTAIARAAAHGAILLNGREKHRRDAVATNGTLRGKFLRCVIACGLQPRARFAKIAREHCLASVRSLLTVDPALA